MLVSDVVTFIEENGYTTRVDVVGAIDIEADFNTFENIGNWVNGYIHSSVRLYYNFGTCDGCLTGEITDFDCLVNGEELPNGWRLGDVYSISSGPYARVIPEIYHSDGINAKQWHRVSSFGPDCKVGASLNFRGVLAQWQACQERENGCHQDHLDNIPSEAYWQLRNSTDSDLTWSTDMTYKNELP